MRSVVDEGVPRDLVKLLRAAGCDVSAFPNEWKGTRNGRLMRLVEMAGFDCLVTCDKNFRHQQNLANARLALLVLPDQRLERLQPLTGQIVLALANVRPGEAYVLRSFR